MGVFAIAAAIGLVAAVAEPAEPVADAVEIVEAVDAIEINHVTPADGGSPLDVVLFYRIDAFGRCRVIAWRKLVEVGPVGICGDRFAASWRDYGGRRRLVLSDVLYICWSSYDREVADQRAHGGWRPGLREE